MFGRSDQLRYTPVQNTRQDVMEENTSYQEKESFLNSLSENEGCPISKRGASPRGWRHTWTVAMVANVALFILSFLLFVATISSNRTVCSPGDTSAYSPFFDHIEVKTAIRHFNNTFWPDSKASIFQQRPSADVDAAWARMTGEQAISITSDEAQKLGLDPKTLWPWPSSVAGPDRYMAMADVFHQIHCLDSMRRAFFPDYYGDLRTKFKDHPFPFEDHFLHCQYMLLNVLTCHADLEVVTFNKVKGVDGPFPNFAVDRKCRNFEDILEWKERNQIVPSKDSDMWTKTPPGIIELDPIGLATHWDG